MSERTILCFGDSNTHGTIAMRRLDDRRRHSKKNRWPTIMGTALGEGFEIIPEGHPGRTSCFDDPIEGNYKSGARVLPSLLESHRPLDLVIIMLGTNDLKPRFHLRAFDIASGVEKLASMVLTSDSGPDGTAPKVLIASPVPIIEAGCLAELFAGGAETSRLLSTRLRERADTLGVGFVDLAEVAEVDPVDGIHLGDDAQAAIGAAMARAVAGILS